MHIDAGVLLATNREDELVVIGIAVALLFAAVYGIPLAWRILTGATKGIAKSISSGIEEGKRSARTKAGDPADGAVCEICNGFGVLMRADRSQTACPSCKGKGRE